MFARTLVMSYAIASTVVSTSSGTGKDQHELNVNVQPHEQPQPVLVQKQKAREVTSAPVTCPKDAETAGDSDPVVATECPTECDFDASKEIGERCTAKAAGSGALRQCDVKFLGSTIFGLAVIGLF